MAIRTVGLAVLLLGLLIGVAFGLTVLDLDGLFRSLSGEPQIAQDNSPSDKRSDGKSAQPASSESIEANLSELANELDGRSLEGASAGSGQPSFDIARVSPDGVSVFAGRAKPFERVNVHVGDSVVGTASADGQGNWTLVTEKKIPDISGELQLTTGAVAEADSATAAPQSPATQSAPPVTAAPTTAAEVNKRLVASLQGLVDEARAQRQSERGDEIDTPAAGTAQTAASPAAGELKQLVDVGSLSDSKPPSAAPSAPPRTPQKAKSRNIPIPVQFVYREAEFTDEGRHAVALLLEYLMLAAPDRITLSGHADERGSSDLNIDLSRERLAAVRDVLREGGYTGELTLVPKGESEPFTGVDRSVLPREELYQLDRRVELRLDD